MLCRLTYLIKRQAELAWGRQYLSQRLRGGDGWRETSPGPWTGASTNPPSFTGKDNAGAQRKPTVPPKFLGGRFGLLKTTF